MKLEYVLWLVLVVVLLIGGALIGRALRPPASDLPAEASGASPIDETAFRDWFWDRRSLDLVVQVALVFAGALGVAAILPHSSEIYDPSDREASG